MALGFVAASSQGVNTNWQPTIGLTQKWSLSCWFWWNNASGYNCVFGGYGSTGNFPLIQLIMEASSSKMYLTYRHDDGNGPSTLGPSTISKLAWHHLVFIRNVTSDKLQTYLDGAIYHDLADTSTGTGTWGYGLGIAERMGSAPDSFLTGAVDDLAIWWGVELSAADIASLYNSKRRIAPTIQGPSLIRWWQLNGPSGVAAAGANTVLDATTNVGHGTPSGNPLYAGSPLTSRRQTQYVHGQVTLLEWNASALDVAAAALGPGLRVDVLPSGLNVATAALAPTPVAEKVLSALNVAATAETAGPALVVEPAAANVAAATGAPTLQVEPHPGAADVATTAQAPTPEVEPHVAQANVTAATAAPTLEVEKLLAAANVAATAETPILEVELTLGVADVTVAAPLPPVPRRAIHLTLRGDRS